MSNDKLAQALRSMVGIVECHVSYAENSSLARSVQHSKSALAEHEAAREVESVTGWQPIETAPKDGRKVILFYLNRNGKPRTVMARWLTDEHAAEIDTDDVGLKAGWYERIDNWDDYTDVAIYEGEPTHWMPLPQPPKD